MGERGNNQRTAARTRKMRARSLRLIRLFVVVICICLAFLAGFAVRDHPGFLQRLGFPSTITGLVQNTPDQKAEKDAFNSVSMRMSEVEDILKEDSLDTYDLDTATQSVLSAFSDAAGDPYLRYYTPDRYMALLSTQDEGYAGIGVLFSEFNGTAYVVDVFEGGEAQAEGIREGDFVVSINGDKTQNWSRSEVSSVLAQSKGSSVVITWRRPETLEADGGEEFTTTLECKEYKEANVSSEYDEERRVGYINVKQFTNTTATRMQSELSSLIDQGAGAIVLDLRDNPGGYLSQAVDIASLFMSSGTVVVVQTVDGNNAKPASGKTATDLPLVVITNKNTAAAAEVVAAALKESQRATLVGTTTLGKGSVQVNHELSFGGALRYTAAYYQTPEGHAIDRVGVTPDVALDQSGEGDAQRDYAMELAGSRVVSE